MGYNFCVVLHCIYIKKKYLCINEELYFLIIYGGTLHDTKQNKKKKEEKYHSFRIKLKFSIIIIYLAYISIHL